MVEPHPVRLVVTGDLKRSRLTVLFRFLLVIPHLIWITLWSFLVYVVTVVNWVATIVLGRSPRLLHNHLAAYLIYSAHVTAYLHLIADPYPGFTSAHSYPVTVEVNAPAKQNRLGVLFRWVLAIPASIFAGALGYVLTLLAVAAWFVALVLGRVPQGVRDLSVYCLRFQAQVDAYGMLLTSRYPSLAIPLE